MASPLHVATRTGHSDVVGHLLNSGAKINPRDRVGRHAFSRHHTWSNMILLECPQCKVFYIGQTKRRLQERLAEHKYAIQEEDTPLHDAVRLGRYKILKLLIVGGADTRLKNHEGFTAVEQVKEWQFDTKETLEKLDQLREVGLVPPLLPT
ncbi:ankyrin repeat domain-containing protein 2-like [Salvelinus fontinalis]|uniref:ankyrin repeat domain-containing protein 2-like n=1 Tax=Salvelinus fontinalis TaxID=8038 RepID=UPI002486129D|nr:ankyrin repeat domain-containing protein 2-like [Salvelinus fontinalis]